jgi:orotidine-5'-phosphate decarboxylase
MKDVIVALDFQNREQMRACLERFGSARPYVKVGKELFYAEGPDVVYELKERGHRVFLDLKLHDRPHTVQGAVYSLARLGADMVNVHAAGGIAMMQAAREASESSGYAHPLIIAVTQLTSTGQDVMNRELLIPGTVEQVVLSYAKNAQEAGLDGVVCSPLETAVIKKELGDAFLTVTPGIRFSNGGIADDQVRVTTPAQAGADGSDYIVVGRPITRADDPLAAYARCVEEFRGGIDG